MQVFTLLQHAVCDCIQSFRKETNMRQKCSTGSPIYITHWKQGAHIARTHPYTNSRPAQVRVSQNRIIFNPLFTGDVVNFCCCCSGNTLLYWWSKYVSWAPRPSYGNSKWQLSCCNAPINVKPAGGGGGGGEAGHGVHRDMTFFSTNVLQIPLLRANHSSHMQKNFPSTGYTWLPLTKVLPMFWF